MHARHRSPGNGYRSNSAGMGFGGSRISPDTSARGHGFYNSDNRSFNNRGFGRGRGKFKSYQQPHQPPLRRGDIFIEAGRLAAEYLVSKGMLPQSALSGHWQNGSFKKQVDDYPVFRQQEDLTQEGRVPAHSRLGSGASDSSFSRRRYNDDFNSRNYGKGRRRGEYYSRHSGSDWGREYVRGASFSDRNRVSPGMEGDDDMISRHDGKTLFGNDIGDVKSGSSSKVEPEKDEATDMGSLQEKYVDEMGSKATSSSEGKEKNDEDPNKVSDDILDDSGGDGGKGSSDSYETENQFNPEQLPIQHSAVEGDHPGKYVSDLLTLCNFAKVPTRTRSSLTSRVPKTDQVLSNVGDNASDTGHFKGSEALVKNDSGHVSIADDVFANTIHDSTCHSSEISKAVPVERGKDIVESDAAYGARPGNARSQSFPDRISMHENEKESNSFTCFLRSNAVKELREKRHLEDSDLNETHKKPREGFPSLVPGAVEHLLLSGSNGNILSSLEERASPDHPEIVASTQDKFLTSSQFPEARGEPSVTYAQEKHFFPNSFKICDLNLIETSDAADNHRTDPVSMYPSTITAEQAGTAVDVGLSMSNSNMDGEYAGPTSNAKNIEIIDLENDSTLEDNNSHRRAGTIFTGTECFSSQGQNTADVADAQIDNLMLSELLTSFSNCNSVSEDVNPLQNEMGLHDGEATLGDDDSIYMSLGEIALSFTPAWEQPKRKEYEKPF